VRAIRQAVLRFFRRLKARCGEGCSSGGSAAQCDVEISLENINNNLVLPPGILAGRGGYTPANVTSSAATLGTYSTLSAPPGMASFAFGGTFLKISTNELEPDLMDFISAGRGSSPRSSLGTQRGSIASTMSGTLRKPSGSTLISLAGMLAERDSIASTSATPTPMGTAALNGSAPSVRERRPSRGSEERDICIRRDLTYVMDNSGRRSSSSRNSEEERRGARERSRRRERERRDRLDRLESLDWDHPLQELDPFIGKHCLNQRVKVSHQQSFQIHMMIP